MLLVNDGSNRNLTNEINQLQGSYPIILFENLENLGKGYSIRSAASASSADYIIFTDVDFPYTTDSLVKLFHTLDKDRCHVALGIRDKNYYMEIPNSRKRISKTLKVLNKKLMNLITSDTQCGLKGMTQTGKKVLMLTKQNRYLIDLEFIKLLSKRNDLGTELITVQLREGVTFSKVPAKKILNEGIAYFKVLFGQ